MKVEIKVPVMGESISEATVGAILKPSGSSVAMDDEVLELETDKVNQVLYAPQAGVVTISVSNGDVVKIGQVVGFIDSAAKGGAAAKPAVEHPKVKMKEEKVQPKEEKKAAPKREEAVSGARISKEAFASEITTEKKEAAVSLAPSKETPKRVEAPQPRQESVVTSGTGRNETRRKMSRIRQVIAKRMVEAQQTAAMLTTFNEIDMTQVITEREKYKEAFAKQYGVKLGFLSFFVKAVVLALQEFPDINSYIDGDEIVNREYYDIGIAVSSEKGLVVPVVRNCDKLSFAEIEKAIETYAKKAREGGLSVDDLQGGGFTITNGGVFGSLLSTPILNPPQSGILGMHKIMKRPVVVDDQIVIRQMMYVALSYDHRIVDGKAAVSFLVSVKNYLEDPARLALKI